MNKKLRITTKAATSALALLLAGSGNALAGNIQPGYYEMEVNCQLNPQLEPMRNELAAFLGVTTTPCTFTETEDSIRIDGGLFDGLFISQDTLRYYGNEINVSNYNCKLADYDGNELKNGNIILSEKDSVIFVQDFSVFSLPLQDYGVNFPAFFIQGATFKAVDVTPLENALAKAQNYRDSLDSNIYYALIENMDARIKEYAQTPKTNETIKQAVDAIEEELSEAQTIVKNYENLNWSELDSITIKCNDYLGKAKDTEYEKSFIGIANAVEEVKQNILITQDEISQKAVQLNSQINGIVNSAEVAYSQLDFTQLLQYVEELNQYQGDSAIMQNPMLAEQIKNDLSDASTIRNNIFSTQDDIDGITNRIASTLDTIKEQSQGEIIVVDNTKFEELNKYLNRAIALVNDNSATDSLILAINYANALKNNTNAEEETINNCINFLNLQIQKAEIESEVFVSTVIVNGEEEVMVISEKDNFEDNTLVIVDRMYSDENEKSQNIIFNDGGQYVAKSVLFNDSIGLQVPCDFVAKELTLDRTPYSNLASFILPISVPLDKVNGKVCKFVSFDGETLSFDEVTDDATEPYVPYIVANHNNSEPLFEKMYDVNVYANDCKAIEAGDATHAGTMVAINLTSNPMYQYYAFVGGKFYSVDNLTVPPTRTFITLTKNGSISARPRTLNFSINGEITGIATVSSDAISFGNVTVYDILGRVVRNDVPSTTCLEGLSDGTYVVNGAKYIIRNNKVQAESQVKNNMMAD